MGSGGGLYQQQPGEQSVQYPHLRPDLRTGPGILPGRHGPGDERHPDAVLQGVRRGKIRSAQVFPGLS